MSNAHLTASDAVDGATDGEIHLDALRVEVDPEARTYSASSNSKTAWS